MQLQKKEHGSTLWKIANVKILGFVVMSLNLDNIHTNRPHDLTFCCSINRDFQSWCFNLLTGTVN